MTTQTESQQEMSSSPLKLIWHNRSKWGKFGLIVLLLIALTTIASLVARSALFESNYEPTRHIAIVAPLTGDSSSIGLSLKRGAEIYVSDVNAVGGIDGQYLGLRLFDNAGKASQSKQIIQDITADPSIVGIVGPWTKETLVATSNALNGKNIALVTPSPQAHDLVEKHPEIIPLTYSQSRETKFLANYMRNVQQEKLVSVVYDVQRHEEMADEFEEAFARFGIPIRHKWHVNSQSPEFQKQLSDTVEKIKAENDSGALYLAMDAPQAAALIEELRAAKAVNSIVGPSALSTLALGNSFNAAEYQTLTDGITTTAPLIYDTANQKVQKFRSTYLSTHGQSPDWVGVYGYESANTLGNALKNLTEDSNSSVPIAAQLFEQLQLDSEARERIEGFSGDFKRDQNGLAAVPIQVGSYNGRQIVSAPTQLQPIGAGEVENYIQAVREGRALYVNDRFMYKTNVVYSGILIEKISDYNQSDQTIQMEFAVWFRYSGDFEPQNIVFENAVDPIVLEVPDRQEKIGEVSYVRYRVKGRFDTDFLDVQRNYGSKLIGTSFRHRVLNMNNLIYVVDVVGVGLTGEATYNELLSESKALVPSLGLVADRSWISQEIVRTSGQGDPNFAGYGKPAPDFSQLGVGIVAVDGTVSLRDLVPNSYLIYLSIFAVFGSIFANLMDRKRDGKRLFWSFQSWLLRAICWPLFLASTGSLTLDYAFQNLEFFYVDMIVPIYEALWWAVGAILFAMAVERFVWAPLESRTGRKVPGSIRTFSAVTVYLLALFGIVAFVLHQELTSLLATSGLLAMVIGLAIQANIANVFSGIVLNMERPFNVDDIILVEDGLEAKVIDISWRTTRAVDNDEKLHCIPNAQATESRIVRICKATGEPYYVCDDVYVTPDFDSDVIIEAVEVAFAAVRDMDHVKSPPTVRMKQMVLSQGVPFLRYRIWYSSLEYKQRHDVIGDVWRNISKELAARGVPFSRSIQIDTNSKNTAEQ